MNRLLTVLILSSMVMGQSTCPEPEYLPLTGWSVQLDPNQVAFDYVADANDPNEPAPRRRLMRPPIKVVLGQTATVNGWACDENGDPMTASASVGTIRVAGLTWTWSYTPAAIGLEYIRLTVSDVREFDDSKSTSGTLVVVTEPKNIRPRFGCASQ